MIEEQGLPLFWNIVWESTTHQVRSWRSKIGIDSKVLGAFDRGDLRQLALMTPDVKDHGSSAKMPRGALDAGSLKFDIE
jgi:hypothetical protein